MFILKYFSSIRKVNPSKEINLVENPKQYNDHEWVHHELRKIYRYKHENKNNYVYVLIILF